nr:hypothetical protein [Shewanella marina]
MIHYQICPIDPNAHLFDVTMHIPNPQPMQQLHLPAWLPGSYMIRDFAKHIISLQVKSAKVKPLSYYNLISKHGKSRTKIIMV